MANFLRLGAAYTLLHGFGLDFTRYALTSLSLRLNIPILFEGFRLCLALHLTSLLLDQWQSTGSRYKRTTYEFANSRLVLVFLR